MKTRMQPIGNAWQKLPRSCAISPPSSASRSNSNARRRDRARPPGARPDQGSAHAHGAQFGRSRHRNAGGAARRRQAGNGHHPAHRLSRRRPHHHRGRRRRPRPRYRARSRPRRSRTGSRPKPRSRRCRRRRSSASSSRPASRPPTQVTSISGRGVGMDVVQTNIDQIGGTIDVKSVPATGHRLHHQDSAHARHHLGADRRIRRRALRDPAARGDRARARRAGGSEHRIERIKDTPVLRLRNKLLPLIFICASCCGSATDPDARIRKRLRRRDAGRQSNRSASWSTACSTPRKSW